MLRSAIMRWETATAFGSPVVPDVTMMRHTSSGFVPGMYLSRAAPCCSPPNSRRHGRPSAPGKEIGVRDQRVQLQFAGKPGIASGQGDDFKVHQPENDRRVQNRI